MDREDPPGDLNLLVRTYRYLNDPRVRQVTIKFAAVLLVVVMVGALTALTFLAPPADRPPAAAASLAGSGAFGPTNDQTACFPPGSSTAWIDENPDVVVTQVVDAGGGSTCLRYRTTTFTSR